MNATIGNPAPGHRATAPNSSSRVNGVSGSGAEGDRHERQSSIVALPSRVSSPLAHGHPGPTPVSDAHIGSATHQPIEHLASLRAMPGMIVLRPADANEVVEAYRVALQIGNRPVCLMLSRQALPTLDRTKYAPASGVAKGGYVLADALDGIPDVLLLATGSEVSLCLAARERLAAEGIKARVVSLPSWELFEEQPQEYRDSVLPPEVPARVAVEEASTFGWERYAGPSGALVGMRSFGCSAPMTVVAEHHGFTSEHVVVAAREEVARQRRSTRV
jgi:transketolase